MTSQDFNHNVGLNAHPPQYFNQQHGAKNPSTMDLSNTHEINSQPLSNLSCSSSGALTSKCMIYSSAQHTQRTLYQDNVMQQKHHQHIEHQKGTKHSVEERQQQHQQQSQNQEIKHVELFGERIVALTINNKERLCLAQISNTLLRDFSYNEIHNRRVALGITCVQCTPVQLELLRRAGAMPSSSRRCGMITCREAERLCRSFLVDEQPPELPEDFYFTVAHRINYGCRGRFVPARYISSRAKCIECFFCGEYFSPNKFIFHSHKQPQSSECNPPDSPNINSWRKHIDLDWTVVHKQEVRYAWEDVKSLFNGGTRRRSSFGNPSIMHARSDTPMSTNDEQSESNNDDNDDCRAAAGMPIMRQRPTSGEAKRETSARAQQSRKRSRRVAGHSCNAQPQPHHLHHKRARIAGAEFNGEGAGVRTEAYQVDELDLHIDVDDSSFAEPHDVGSAQDRQRRITMEPSWPSQLQDYATNGASKGDILSLTSSQMNNSPSSSSCESVANLTNANHLNPQSQSLPNSQGNATERINQPDLVELLRDTQRIIRGKEVDQSQLSTKNNYKSSSSQQHQLNIYSRLYAHLVQPQPTAQNPQTLHMVAPPSLQVPQQQQLPQTQFNVEAQQQAVAAAMAAAAAAAAAASSSSSTTMNVFNPNIDSQAGLALRHQIWASLLAANLRATNRTVSGVHDANSFQSPQSNGISASPYSSRTNVSPLASMDPLGAKNSPHNWSTNEQSSRLDGAYQAQSKITIQQGQPPIMASSSTTVGNVSEVKAASRQFDCITLMQHPNDSYKSFVKNSDGNSQIQ